MNAQWKAAQTLLRARDLRFLFAAQAISLTGTWLQSTAQSLLVYRLAGGKAEALALVAACTALPLVVFGWIGGRIAERFDRRRVLLCTQAFELLFAAILAVSIYTETVSLTLVYSLAFLLGCAEAVFFPTAQRFLQDVTGKQNIGIAVWLSATIINVARCAGPTIAGWLIASGGVAFTFLLNAASFLPVIAVYGMLHQSAGREETVFVEDGEAKCGPLDIRIKGLFVAIGLLNVFGQSAYAVLPALVHGDAVSTGYLLGAAGCGSLVSSLFVLPRVASFLPGQRMSFGVAWMGSWLAVVALPVSLIFKVVAMFMIGVSTAVVYVTALAVLQTLTPPRRRASSFGWFSAMFNGSPPLAALLLVWTATIIGLQHVLFVSALTECGGALLLLGSRRWRQWLPPTQPSSRATPAGL